MKKNYQRPEVFIVNVSPRAGILVEGSSKVNALGTNLGDDALHLGGGTSTEQSRTKGYSAWDDDWSE